DHCRRGKPGKCATVDRFDTGMFEGNSAHMQLEDDRLFPRDLRTAILAPREGRFDNATFRDLACVIAPIERQVGTLTANTVAKQRIAPTQPTVQRSGVRID